MQDEAHSLGVPLWVAPRLLETLKEAAAAGYLDQDSMTLIQYMGEQAGIECTRDDDGPRCRIEPEPHYKVLHTRNRLPSASSRCLRGNGLVQSSSVQQMPGAGHRNHGASSTVLDYIVLLPRALPGLVVGLAFFWIFLLVPFLTSLTDAVQPVRRLSDRRLVLRLAAAAGNADPGGA